MLTFVTGNQKKAEYLSRFLDYAVGHQKLDIPEIQSLDLQEVALEKARQAYKIIQSPVLVEDVSLEFGALGRLPGTYIKWFMKEMSLQAICDLLENKSRRARASCVFVLIDEQGKEYLFQGELLGEIANSPRGEAGYGWDPIFIPDEYPDRTRAELNEEEYKKLYFKIKPFDQLKVFLENSSL